jgi:ATP-dependent DNA helicase RecG
VPFDTPIQFLKGVGPQFAGVLAKLGIFTLADLWMFFPRRYEDRRSPIPYSSLQPDTVHSVLGQVVSAEETRSKSNRSLLRAKLTDGRYHIEALWFNQPFLKRSLTPGAWVWVTGKWEYNSYFQGWELKVSETEVASEADFRSQLGIGQVVPIYPLTAGVSAYRIRNLARQWVSRSELRYLPDVLPLELQKSNDLIPLSEAIYEMHFPSSREAFKAARKRLVFDEFFFFQVSLAQKRLEWRYVPKAPVLSPPGAISRAYLEKLPYALTKAQREAVDQIYQDVATPTRMNRLLQGDVGCGKTDVAILTLLAAVDSGFTGAVMVPTEILAEQHYARLSRQLEGLPVEVILLKGSLTAKTKRQRVAQLLESRPRILVGTHALLEPDVHIPDLAVVIIDEQHRFGVDQRMKLQAKGLYPHGLFMTATPIPRSLMLTCFGDLHKTIISEMPPGRTPIQTRWVTESHIEKFFESCRATLREGRQLYVVYPLVEESEKLDLKSAIEGYEQLSQGAFSEFSVGLLHGKMKAAEKKEVMDAFKSGEIQVLVSTTVIEVGVDVPNATVMVVQHANRFGLAQLHQLRGRVGRGQHAALCVLVTDSAGKHNPRIKAMLATQDGFQLAEMDLKIRGPGDLLGRRQAGLPLFKVADLVRDEAILSLARRAAFALVAQDPTLNHPNHRKIAAEIIKRFGHSTQPN